MEFFEVKIGERNNNEWRAILKKDVDLDFGIINKLNEGLEPKIDSPIEMNLINVQLPEDQCEWNEKELDLIYWTDDITLDAFRPTNRNGSYFIISEKFKNVLNDFDLPHHFYLPIILKVQNDVPPNSKKYFILFIVGNLVDNVNYKESSYVLETKSRPKTIIERFNKKSFNSKEEYFTTKSNYRRNERQLLNFDRVVLNSNFDVMWGIPNVLYVNKDVERQIRDSGIEGIDIRKIDNPTYIMKSENLDFD